MHGPRRDALRPLVFSTIVCAEIRRLVDSAIALRLDCFGIFFPHEKRSLGVPSSPSVGTLHRADALWTTINASR